MYIAYIGVNKKCLLINYT